MNRGQLRTRVLRRADAATLTAGSQRWDTTPGVSGEVDQLMAVAYDREWINVLNSQPTITLARRTVTTDSEGRVPMASLQAGSGDTLERVYRVLKVYRDNRALEQVKWRDFGDADQWNINHKAWWREGAFLRLLPREPNTTATVTVNTLPQRVDALSSDTAVLVVPDDLASATFEEIVTLEAAAMMLAKGGVEDPTPLLQQAERLRSEMLQDLARVGEGPMVMMYNDDAEDWGG